MLRPSDLTLNQNLAVTSDASPLVVRAGAGSGKTRVLVERYLRLVLERKKAPSRILAAAFTEKAAAEMKERVAAKLLEAERPDLVAELNAAPICTLHSFCSRLIAPYALQLGIDPNSRIIEEHEARLLQEETLTHLFSRWRQEERQSLAIIVSRLHWPGEHQLRPGRSPASRGFSRQFLDLVQSVRCAGKADQPAFAPINISLKQISDQVNDHLQRLDKLLWEMDRSCALKSQEKALAARRFLDGYCKLSNKQSPEALEVIQQLQKIPLRVSDEIKAVLRPIREKLCPLLCDFYYLPDYQSIRSSLNDLFVEFLAVYTERKRQAGVLDFLDLEEIALKILRSPDTPAPVDFVLIDEAQDLNPVQWEIVASLTRKAPLFAVGDAQQSIYGFRDAEVALFTGLAQKVRQGEGQEILLGENFRSRQSVLAMVNRFFARIWGAGCEIPFLPLEAEYPYPQTEDDSVELLLTCGEDRQKAREAEAIFLARRLNEILRGRSFRIHRETGRDASGQPILVAENPEWGDVLVLVRSSSSFAPLERAFKELGIPCIIQAGRGFWDALEISDLLALLRCLEDPGDDFSLACLLRSPAVAFSDDDLIELRLVEVGDAAQESRWSTEPIYKRLTAIADATASAGTLPFRAAKFLQLFDRLYHLKDCLPLRSLIQIWIEETGLESIWSRDREGHLIQSNVRKFLRLCDAHAGESSARLRAAFEEMRLRDLQEGLAPAALSDGGAVRVMTVHSAKGLEAPIVAIFDMNYQPKGGPGAFLYSLQDGATFGIEGKTLGDKPHQPQLFEKINKFKNDRSGQEEERVLYVAMTRAREKLILSASFSESERGVGRAQGWLKLLMATSLIPDSEQLFDAAAVPSGPLQVFDAQGVAAPLMLKRASDLPPLQPAEIQKSALQPQIPAEIPSGFPASPEPGSEALSVVEYLKHVGKYASDVQLSDEGELLSDESAAGGIAMGLWVHRILQVLPFDSDQAGLELIARCEAAVLFGEDPQAAQLQDALRLVSNFLHSPLANQIRQARMVLREFPIIFELNNQLLKAKLDLAFEDDSGWTILDYKSDRQPSVESVEAYSTQISLYARAWQLLTGEIPRRALLFFLATGKAECIHLESAT